MAATDQSVMLSTLCVAEHSVGDTKDHKKSCPIKSHERPYVSGPVTKQNGKKEKRDNICPHLIVVIQLFANLPEFDRFKKCNCQLCQKMAKFAEIEQRVTTLCNRKDKHNLQNIV